MTHKSYHVFFYPMTDTITTKPFQSQAQWAACFAKGDPRWDCRKWARESPGGKGKRFRRLPYKKVKAEVTFQPPASAQGNARKVLAWREQHGDAVRGMTPVGWARARQLASGKPISLTTVRRMAAFNRHRKNASIAPEYRDEPWRDAGHVAWLGWGGTTGIDWALATSARNKAIALKGEQIAPGVTRIRGDLCNVHGKYGSCAEATGGEKPKRATLPAGKRSPKPKRKPRAGRAARPKKTDAQRAQERESARAAERQQNRDSVKQRMADADTGLGPAGFDALMAFAEGQQPTGTMAKGLAEMGLAEQAADGSYRMTPTGRAVVAAANAGDYQRALDAISRGTDTAGRRQQRAQEQTARRTAQEQRRQEAEQRRRSREAERQQRRGASGGGGRSASGDKRTEEKPKPRPKRTPRSAGGASSGGGGKGGGNRGPSKPTIPPMPKLPKPAQPAASERQQQNRASVKQRMAENDVGLSPSGFDTVMAFAEGKQPDPARGDELVAMGLAEKNTDGTYRMTTAARTVVGAADAGDYQRAVDAVARAREAAGKKKSTKVPKARRVSRATVSGRGSSGNPANLSYPLLQSHVAQAPSQTGVARTQSIPHLTIYKDKAGRYRWVLFSSNAYRDRDQEIVSTKALADDCDRADADGSYGPLRWWHVPGVDIGDCDFNAMHGRILIESGTFRDERIGAAVARKAKALQVSIGFIHPPDEPDAGGVFHHIRRFERSLVPAGKASNPFTHVFVKEMPPMASLQERWKEFVALFDGDEAAARQYAASGTLTQKGLDRQGVVFKSINDPIDPDTTANTTGPIVYAAPDGTQGIIQDGQFIALKAVEPPPAEAKAGGMEADMPAGEMEMDEGDGLTLSPEDIAAISQAVASALAPLVGALDIETKIRGGVDELKTMLGGYQKQKDSESAEQKADIATLKAAIEQSDKDRALLAARLAELEGEQPIATKGYRASADPATVIAPERLKELQSDEHPFKDMQAFLMGLNANGAQLPPS